MVSVKERVYVSAVQLDVAWMDPEENIRRMRSKIREVVNGKQVDLIVFPELVNCGYVQERDAEFAEQYIHSTETIPGPTTEALGEEAKRHGIHIAVGIGELHPEVPYSLYNSAVLIGPRGEILGIHRKNHIPNEEKHYFYPGNTLDTYRTELGNIALVICYDVLFPEMIRILALKGAEMICGMLNSPRSEPHVPERLKFWAATRAYENKTFVIACNRVGTEGDLVFHGNSVIVAPTGEVLAYSESEEEEILSAVLEESVLVRERGLNPVFRDRRPEMYAPLCQPF